MTTGKLPDGPKCATPIERINQLAGSLGINGTPTLIPAGRQSDTGRGLRRRNRASAGRQGGTDESCCYAQTQRGLIMRPVCLIVSVLALALGGCAGP